MPAQARGPLLTTVQQFFRRTHQERKLWWEAWRSLGKIRVRLWLKRFDAQTLVQEEPVPGNKMEFESHREVLQQVAWAVKSAARFIPGGTCLTQALSAQELLRRRHVTSRIRIGVAKNDLKGFHAHAWLEACGRGVVGAEQSDRFTPLI